MTQKPPISCRNCPTVSFSDQLTLRFKNNRNSRMCTTDSKNLDFRDLSRIYQELTSKKSKVKKCFEKMLHY